jgi:hypothetical protein
MYLLERVLLSMPLSIRAVRAFQLSIYSLCIYFEYSKDLDNRKKYYQDLLDSLGICISSASNAIVNIWSVHAYLVVPLLQYSPYSCISRYETFTCCITSYSPFRYMHILSKVEFCKNIDARRAASRTIVLLFQPRALPPFHLKH